MSGMSLLGCLSLVLSNPALNLKSDILLEDDSAVLETSLINVESSVTNSDEQISKNIYIYYYI
jgi:hypothetical protein